MASSLNARLNAKVNMLELNAGANTLEGPGGISASRDWRPSSNPKRSTQSFMPSHQTPKARTVIVCLPLTMYQCSLPFSSSGLSEVTYNGVHSIRWSHLVRYSSIAQSLKGSCAGACTT